MKILIVDTFYGPYLQRLYASGDLIQQPWAVQHKAHFEGGFGTGDAYSHGLGLLGVEAIEIVANSIPLQRAWAPVEPARPAPTAGSGSAVVRNS